MDMQMDETHKWPLLASYTTSIALLARPDCSSARGSGECNQVEKAETGLLKSGVFLTADRGRRGRTGWVAVNSR
jgi:hypothetical protein